MNRSTKFLALLCILSIIVAGCVPIPATVIPSDAPTPAPTSAPTAATGAYWPTNGWRTSTPEEQGMDSQMLAHMVAEIKERQMNVHSLLVIRNGYLVNETYFGTYQPDDRQDVHSVAKSFTATLVGITLDKGYLGGTDQRIVDLF